MHTNDKVPNELTDFQKLNDFSMDYGLPKIILRAHERLVNYGIRDGQAIVVVERFRTRETSGKLIFTAHGMLVRTWRFDESDDWVEQAPLMIWDADFTPVPVAKYDVKDPTEVRESEMWAAYCHRPGASRYPLDSFDRVASGDASAAMRKHWGI